MWSCKCTASKQSWKEKEDEMGKASGGPKSDLGNLTPRAFVIVYIWPHWHDNGTFWTISLHINLYLNIKFQWLKKNEILILQTK